MTGPDSISVYGVGLVVALLLLLVDDPARAEESRAAVPAPVATFLQKYCLDCHDRTSAEGGVDLDPASIDWSARSTQEHWQQAHRMLARQLMPPADAEQPGDDRRRAMLAWLDAELIDHLPIGGTLIRRLSSREYAETIRSLLLWEDFELPAGFPADNRLHGFDNQGAGLVMAVSHLESFVDLATEIADTLFPPPRPIVASQVFQLAPQDLVISYSSACLIDGEMRLASSGENVVRNATWPVRFEAPAAGMYRIEVTVSANAPEAGVVPELAIATMRASGRGNLQWVEQFEIATTAPQTISTEVQLDIGETVALRYASAPLNYDDKATYRKFLTETFADDPRLAAAWDHVGNPPRGGSGWRRVKEALELTTLDVDAYQPGEPAVTDLVKQMVKGSVNSGETLVYKYFEEGPNLGIHELLIEGPTSLTMDATERQRRQWTKRLLGPAAGKSDADSLRSFFDDFLTRAFRRPASTAEVERYVALVRDETERTRSVDQGWHLAIRTLLVSPSLLYRSATQGQMSDLELASRLAYFLTSGPPDRELLATAIDGRLAESATLRAEATRLLAGEGNSLYGGKFTRDFCDQWLDLAALDRLMPDARLIRRFNAQHRLAMREEVELTFAHILEHNLPVRDFIAPDFLFTDRLVGQEIYRLPEFDAAVTEDDEAKTADGLRRIPIARDGRHGGLLSMAAVMMATANGVDTQPVLRGVWVLENILGAPPPDPPDAVPALTPDTAGLESPRERLAAHMADASCARCHREIDPLGFVLENFDPIGRWRDHYPRYVEGSGDKPKDGLAVDASGRLPGGVELTDVTDLKRWLSENPEPFACCLAEKLMTYATGRNLNYRERHLIAELVDRRRDDELRFHDLLLELVDSPVFRIK